MLFCLLIFPNLLLKQTIYLVLLTVTVMKLNPEQNLRTKTADLFKKFHGHSSKLLELINTINVTNPINASNKSALMTSLPTKWRHVFPPYFCWVPLLIFCALCSVHWQGLLQYRPGCTMLCGWLINSFSSVIKIFLQYFSIEDTH